MSHISRKLFVESVLEKMLRDLEEKERVFETYKVASGSNLHFKTRSIMDFIDFEMHRVISLLLLPQRFPRFVAGSALLIL
ncbi:hypothetical protein Y032_0027g1509 [Ancylostoma ceylanicum]|uniref:Uncharacterized protein n=1 Tax=Ancylostoma ceylanicum TaxID=53326 RepID=A0A016UVC6_9BILA|nr:hypothetical protein Y032_0027g1509 [Ancylostoma ceylanicum]